MRSHVEALLRAKKLDRTLLPAAAEAAWSREEREARLLATGWPSVDDALAGGFPRGECSEIVGSPSSGRTALGATLLAEATRRGEIVALVDTLDRFDPRAAEAMAIDLTRLLWVRGTPLSPQMLTARPRPRVPAHMRARREQSREQSREQAREEPREEPREERREERREEPSEKRREQRRETRREQPSERRREERDADEPEFLKRVIERALKSFGLIAQAGGFGVVVLDLGDVPMPALRRLPFTTWFRLQRLIEGSETVGLLLAPESIGRSARGITVRVGTRDTTRVIWTGTSHQARVLTGFALQPQVLSARRLSAGARVRIAATA